jgi:Holliday junction resolvasome RuvABC DNA-binding subunit
LATRIISELKDKRDVLSAVNQSYNVNKSDTPILEKDDNKSKKDAISGLVNLGFSSMESFSTVSRIVANSQKEISVEDLIRLGLRELSSDLSD